MRNVLGTSLFAFDGPLEGVTRHRRRASPCSSTTLLVKNAECPVIGSEAKQPPTLGLRLLRRRAARNDMDRFILSEVVKPLFFLVRRRTMCLRRQYSHEVSAFERL
jgi:hypothetical protein